jgi:3-hydroxy-9,10-secoandrosta-1,3,5(10)-triene-9,17-dione monooxygenase reductase component
VSDSSIFRDILGCYPTGVVVVASIVDGRPLGMTVGTFSSVSLNPPLVSFMPMRSSRRWARIRATGRFCASILGADQGDLSRQFAQSDIQMQASPSFTRSTSGAPVLEGSIAYVDCTVSSVHSAGDHDIVVGEVNDLKKLTGANPLIFHGGRYTSVAPLSPVLS